MEVRWEGDYIPIHCHHQNEFSIKVGSVESHFNISLTVSDKVTRQCPQTITLKWMESPIRFEPRSLCLPAYRLTARPNRLSLFSFLFFFFLSLLLWFSCLFHTLPFSGRKLRNWCSWTVGYLGHVEADEDHWVRMSTLWLTGLNVLI